MQDIPPIISASASVKTRAWRFQAFLIAGTIAAIALIACVCYFQLQCLIWDFTFHPRPVPTDKELMDEFQQKRPVLERLKTMVETDGWPWIADWGCPSELRKRSMSNERMKEYQRLLKSVKRGGVSIADGDSQKRIVTITVFSWAIAVGKGGQKGFAYCYKPPPSNECLENLDYEKPPQRYARHFRLIAGNWYLYRKDP